MAKVLNKGWYFNKGLSGDCRLTLTRRGISDAHWQLLLLALRIQIRHAMFGARDQFGLGVLTAEQLPEVAPLSAINFTRPELTNTLWHTAFFTIKFTKIGLRNASLALPEAIKLGLATRYALRNALRDNPDTLKTLRHQMLGALNEYGSATNVSAVYPMPLNSTMFEARIWVQLKPEQKEQRSQVMKAFTESLKLVEMDGWRAGALDYEWAGGIAPKETAKHKIISDWINHLAGV